MRAVCASYCVIIAIIIAIRTPTDRYALFLSFGRVSTPFEPSRRTRRVAKLKNSSVVNSSVVCRQLSRFATRARKTDISMRPPLSEIDFNTPGPSRRSKRIESSRVRAAEDASSPAVDEGVRVDDSSERRRRLSAAAVFWGRVRRKRQIVRLRIT